MKRKTLGATALAVALMFSMAASAVASGHMLDPFTQDELDNNWEADRLYPSGGVESVAAHGRTDVAAISMDSSQASDQGDWWGYEGIKQVADHGSAVQVDLYVPSAWQGHPANAGFWASDAPTISVYPIIAFRNSDTVPAGFYTWDGAGWVNSGIPVNYDGWNTLALSLDTTNEVINYAINGQDAGDVAATGDSIGQVFLNQYNYGAFDPDNAVDYTSHWHVGLEDIDSKDQCRDGSWEEAGFKNQGQCIKFVSTGQDSR